MTEEHPYVCVLREDLVELTLALETVRRLVAKDPEFQGIVQRLLQLDGSPAR